MNYAPVVIFCYTRLIYLKRVVVALKKNLGASETEIFFYSDGGKDENTWRQVQVVRDYLHQVTGFKKITVIEQKENKKLEYNVLQGISEVVNQFGRVIVLEDDVLPSKYFLKFMNDSLDYYENNKKVMSVSAYNFLKFPKDFPETFAWRKDGNWGWCTWKDRWAKLEYVNDKQAALAQIPPEMQKEMSLQGVFPCFASLNLEPIPWDFFWYWCVFKNGVGISVKHSLTKHIGVDGTHFRTTWWEKLMNKPFFSPVGFADREVCFLTDDISRNAVAERKFYEYYRDGRMYEKSCLGKMVDVWKKIIAFLRKCVKALLPYGLVWLIRKIRNRKVKSL